MLRCARFLVVLPLMSAIVALSAHTSVAQPPRTRPPQTVPPETRPPETLPPDRRTPTPDDVPRRDPGAWPKTRQPGQQRYQGRQSRSRAPGEFRIRVRPGDRPSSSWYVGVYTQRAPRGVRLSGIAPGGPAHRFGLERDDYILDAGGYVVGEYEGAYYPLAYALEFAAGPNGWVEFLVWNKRTFDEETLWVQLQRRR
jgi:hypothetical protein